jgi:hypothetical protein
VHACEVRSVDEEEVENREYNTIFHNQIAALLKKKLTLALI